MFVESASSLIPSSIQSTCYHHRLLTFQATASSPCVDSSTAAPPTTSQIANYAVRSFLAGFFMISAYFFERNQLTIYLALDLVGHFWTTQKLHQYPPSSYSRRSWLSRSMVGRAICAALEPLSCAPNDSVTWLVPIREYWQVLSFTISRGSSVPLPVKLVFLLDDFCHLNGSRVSSLEKDRHAIIGAPSAISTNYYDSINSNVCFQ